MNLELIAYILALDEDQNGESFDITCDLSRQIYDWKDVTPDPDGVNEGARLIRVDINGALFDEFSDYIARIDVAHPGLIQDVALTIDPIWTKPGGFVLRSPGLPVVKALNIYLTPKE